MDARWMVGLTGLALAACSPAETAVSPEPPLVQIAEVVPSPGAVSRYTGVIRARTESNLGFRVGGKIFERLVDPGDRVRLGQPLMRLDLQSSIDTRGEFHAETLLAYSNLARCLAVQGKQHEATPLLKRELLIHRRLLAA